MSFPSNVGATQRECLSVLALAAGEALTAKEVHARLHGRRSLGAVRAALLRLERRGITTVWDSEAPHAMVLAGT